MSSGTASAMRSDWRLNDSIATIHQQPVHNIVVAAHHYAYAPSATAMSAPYMTSSQGAPIYFAQSYPLVLAKSNSPTTMSAMATPANDMTNIMNATEPVTQALSVVDMSSPSEPLTASPPSATSTIATTSPRAVTATAVATVASALSLSPPSASSSSGSSTASNRKRDRSVVVDPSSAARIGLNALRKSFSHHAIDELVAMDVDQAMKDTDDDIEDDADESVPATEDGDGDGDGDDDDNVDMTSANDEHKRERRLKSFSQLRTLKTFFSRSTRANKAELSELCKQTGLPARAIIRWLRNERHKQKKTRLANERTLAATAAAVPTGIPRATAFVTVPSSPLSGGSNYSVNNESPSPVGLHIQRPTMQVESLLHPRSHQPRPLYAAVIDRAIAQPHSSHFTQVNAARKAIPTQVPISPHSPATPQPTHTPPSVTQLPMHVQLLKRVQLHNTAVGSAPTRPVVGIPVHSAHSPFRVVPQSDVAVATETAVRTANAATTGATVIAMMRDDEEEPPPKRRLSVSIGEKDSNVAVTLAGMSNSQQTTSNAPSPTQIAPSNSNPHIQHHFNVISHPTSTEWATAATWFAAFKNKPTHVRQHAANTLRSTMNIALNPPVGILFSRLSELTSNAAPLVSSLERVSLRDGANTTQSNNSIAATDYDIIQLLIAQPMLMIQLDQAMAQTNISQYREEFI